MSTDHSLEPETPRPTTPAPEPPVAASEKEHPPESLDLVLVPGLWLDAASWDAVVPHLSAAGHAVHPVSPAGTEPGADPASVSLDDQVAGIVAVVDACEGPVVLVGHSASCSLVHAAADARPDRVVRVVHVGGFPASDGSPIAPWFKPQDGVLAVPALTDFDDADVVDFDDGTRALFAELTRPSPGRLATDPLRLHDDRRYDVPATAICPEYRSDDLRDWMAQGESGLAELARLKQLDLVDLPGGHWPQLTQPDRLAEVLLTVADKSLPPHGG